MSIFGLPEPRLRDLVQSVSGDVVLEEAAVAERFARATWTVIAEPGDGAAGALIAEVGPSAALSLVLDNEHASATSTSSALASGLDRWKPRLRSLDVERALQLAARVGARLLVPAETGGDASAWPHGVDDLGVHAPVALWARGDPARLSSRLPGIALVGARAATGYGEHVAGEIAAGLAERDHAIVSGAAYGIDGMAHRAALAAGGPTVAFLAGGVDRFYPAGHDELLHRIVGRGVVVSELPCGAAPTKWRFLERNRLIAAASAATVVVEAGARSGSLNTAGHAATLGRPLGAVPGPVTSPTSAGCHRLLREYDAVCVTDAAEVAELVDGSDTSSGPNRPRDDPDTIRVLDAMTTRSGRTPPEIAAQSGLAIATVLAVLGTLAVSERVREVPDGWVAVSRRT
ncbi:DNA-processing protein DprA [Humibacter soli]